MPQKKSVLFAHMYATQKNRKLNKVQRDLNKIKKQVRTNTEVVTLDSSNFTTSGAYPADIGRGTNSPAYTYIVNADGVPGIPCRAFQLNRCAKDTGNEVDYQRTGDKLFLRSLNLRFNITTGYDDQPLGGIELSLVRYALIWVPGVQDFKSSHTAGAGTFISSLLEYPNDITSPWRQKIGFKYSVLREGMAKLSYNTNSGGQPQITGRIKMNLSKRKNKESQYQDADVNPLNGKLYFAVFAAQSTTTPTGAVPAKIKFSSRLICNE